MTQIKRLLRTGLFAVIVLWGASACSDNDSINEIKESGYTFKDIEWAILEDDAMETSYINIAPEIFTNETDVEQPVTFCSVDGYNQTSQFYSDNPDYFQLLTQIPIDVSIPSGETAFDGFFHTSGGPQVPLSLEEHLYPPHSYSKSSFKLPPNHMVTFSATIIERKVSATYRAYFTGNDSGKQIEIMGKWKGIYYTSCNSKSKTEEIK